MLTPVALVAAVLAGAGTRVRHDPAGDIPSPLRSVATDWGQVGRETRRRLERPTSHYPSPVLQGEKYQQETRGYVVEKSVEMDLDWDGRAETIIATQNGPARWRDQDRGPEGHIMIFDGRTKALRYKSRFDAQVVSLVVLTEGLPVVGSCRSRQGGAEPFIVAVGGDKAFTVEVVAYSKPRGVYERLLKVGSDEGAFFRWHFLEWGYPRDTLQVYGYLWDKSGLAISASPGKGLVLVAYAWQPDKRRFTLILPEGS